VVAAAVAFGASVPAGKALLAGVPPVALAGGLYLAAGIVLAAVLLGGRVRALGATGAGTARSGPRLTGGEVAALGLAVLAGGVIGPLALFTGLARVPAYTASLLLNFEVVLTIGLAAMLGGWRSPRRRPAGTPAGAALRWGARSSSSSPVWPGPPTTTSPVA
jgi:drug/metabolite transporter (DMT)-like permease